jgi:hypothetical protein
MALEHRIPMCETIDPEDLRQTTELYISRSLCSQCFNTAPVDYENLRCVKEVLLSPQRIFQGVRDFQEGGWCYTGVPNQWYIRTNVIVPFPREKFVFAVYINPVLSVYEWRAEYRAEDDPLNPADWQERYERLIWKSIS